MSNISVLDTRFNYYFKIPECNSKEAITITMAANNFQNVRQRFNDSPLHDQDIPASEPPFYNQSSCYFLQDNLQQAQEDQYYMTEQGSSLNLFRQDSPLPSDMNSFGLGVPNHANTSHGNYYYDYTNTQNTDIFYNGTSSASCSRNYQQPYSLRMIEGLSLSDPSLQCQLRDSDQKLFRTGNSGGFYSRQASMSRTPSLPDAASCKAEDDAEDDAASNTEESKIGEPYAKLIHRALMGAPSHSMALQEIYQWFIDNTEKGSSSGSGWRNSIRHNLSMNAAFCKTERPVASPSDVPAKKTSEWVLADWAITDGVTPTTRYRKTTSKKSARPDSHAAMNASRQNAGKKGGRMTGRTKTLRMAQGRGLGFDGQALRARDAERDREARRERKRYHQLRTMATPPQEDLEQRPFSPTTPTAAAGMNVANPYYFKDPGFEAMDVAVYDMGHVQGVYTGDDGPVFTHNGLPSLDVQPRCSPGYPANAGLHPPLSRRMTDPETFLGGAFGDEAPKLRHGTGDAATESVQTNASAAATLF
ncbi:hypothetical protein V490_01104 [Pseudogymnoascus sp. VKM F-3557]|nr:hypothetical protein V490_01104 [Pseudogymnoascus sp. VKM F-3557]